LELGLGLEELRVLLHLHLAQHRVQALLFLGHRVPADAAVLAGARLSIGQAEAGDELLLLVQEVVVGRQRLLRRGLGRGFLAAAGDLLGLGLAVFCGRGADVLP
jgi:hypothetical protein